MINDWRWLCWHFWLYSVPYKGKRCPSSTQMWADGHMAATEAWMEGRACQHGFSSSSSHPGTLSDSCFWITDAKAKRNRSQEPGFYSSVKCHSSIHQEDEIPSLPSKKAALPVLLYLTRILQTCQGLGHQRDKGYLWWAVWKLSMCKFTPHPSLYKCCNAPFIWKAQGLRKPAQKT